MQLLQLADQNCYSLFILANLDLKNGHAANAIFRSCRSHLLVVIAYNASFERYIDEVNRHERALIVEHELAIFGNDILLDGVEHL